MRKAEEDGNRKIGKYKMMIGEEEVSAYRDADEKDYVITNNAHIYLSTSYYVVYHQLPQWIKEGKIHRIRFVGSKGQYIPVEELDLLKKEIHSSRESSAPPKKED